MHFKHPIYSNFCFMFAYIYQLQFQYISFFLCFFFAFFHYDENSAFCELLADSTTRTFPVFFFCSFIFFDCSDKILTCLETCLQNSWTYRHIILHLCSAQFGLVMSSFVGLKGSGSWYISLMEFLACFRTERILNVLRWVEWVSAHELLALLPHCKFYLMLDKM